MVDTPGTRLRLLRLVMALAMAVLLPLSLVAPAAAQTLPGPTSLSNPDVSPRTASFSTPISFSVVYRNHNGSPPDHVSVVVDGTSHPLSPAAGGAFKEGILFRTAFALPVGTHQVSFEAADTSHFNDALGAGSVTVTAPLPTPTATPTPTPTTTPAPTPTPRPSATPAPTPTPTATPRPSTPAPDPTATPNPTPPPTATPVSTATPTPRPAASVAVTPAPSASVGPASTQPSPSVSPQPRPSASTPSQSAAAGGAVGPPGGPTTQPPAGAGSADGGLGPVDAGGGGTSGEGAVGAAKAEEPGLDPVGPFDGLPALVDPMLHRLMGDEADQAVLAQGFGSRVPPIARVLPMVIATTGSVTLFAAFIFFGKRRRDGDPTAPDDALAAAAASPLNPLAAAPLVPVPQILPEEAGMPRWRRPSLQAARKADPNRSATAEVHLTFDRGLVGPIEGRERRLVRYRLVCLLDAPDEVRSQEIGLLDQGDEVQLLERSGAYWRVLCPDGRQGWLHRMTLGDRVDTPPAVESDGTFPPARGAWMTRESASADTPSWQSDRGSGEVARRAAAPAADAGQEDIFGAYLNARRQRLQETPPS